MIRFSRILLAGAFGVLMALPATAQQLSLGALSNYLNGLKTARAEFTQINNDGTISTGTILIKRPGRVRFEYNPPDPALVLSGGGQLAIFDAKSNEPPDRYPLSQTPLSIILARNVNLGQANMVTSHRYDANAKTTTVVAQDPQHPEYGNIQLVFTGPKPELRQWIITDDSGTETTVILGELHKGGSIAERKFNILAEMRTRGFE